MAAERTNNPPLSLPSTPSITSVSNPSVRFLRPRRVHAPLLSNSMHAFLTAGAGVAGPLLPGRPSMSVFSSASTYNLLSGDTHDVADHPAVPALPVVDQPFVVGSRFSPVPGLEINKIIKSPFGD